MASITGFGGIFLRAGDPKALYRWYERPLAELKSQAAAESFTLPALYAVADPECRGCVGADSKTTTEISGLRLRSGQNDLDQA